MVWPSAQSSTHGWSVVVGPAVDVIAVDEVSIIVEWPGVVVPPPVDVCVSGGTGAVVIAVVVGRNCVVVALVCGASVGGSDGCRDVVTGFVVVSSDEGVVVCGADVLLGGEVPVVSVTTEVDVSVGFVIGAVDEVVDRGAVVVWFAGNVLAG